MSPPSAEPNATCPGEKPEKSDPFNAPILISFPIRVSPPVNERTFSLLLNIFQSESERNPLLLVVACVRVNSHVSGLYESGHTVTERSERPIFVASMPERVNISAVLIAMLPERVAMVPERAFCARKSVK